MPPCGTQTCPNVLSCLSILAIISLTCSRIKHSMGQHLASEYIGIANLSASLAIKIINFESIQESNSEHFHNYVTSYGLTLKVSTASGIPQDLLHLANSAKDDSPCRQQCGQVALLPTSLQPIPNHHKQNSSKAIQSQQRDAHFNNLQPTDTNKRQPEREVMLSKLPAALSSHVPGVKPGTLLSISQRRPISWY